MCDQCHLHKIEVRELEKINYYNFFENWSPALVKYRGMYYQYALDG